MWWIVAVCAFICIIATLATDDSASPRIQCLRNGGTPLYEYVGPHSYEFSGCLLKKRAG